MHTPFCDAALCSSTVSWLCEGRSLLLHIWFHPTPKKERGGGGGEVKGQSIAKGCPEHVPFIGGAFPTPRGCISPPLGGGIGGGGGIVLECHDDTLPPLLPPPIFRLIQPSQLISRRGNKQLGKTDGKFNIYLFLSKLCALISLLYSSIFRNLITVFSSVVLCVFAG